MTYPERSEIWLVDLNPIRGQEIEKTRPVVVMTADIFNSIPLRIIIPITSWQPKFAERPFMVEIEATTENGLDRDSAGNVLQIRSISTERFVKHLGRLSPKLMEEILAGIAICIDYSL